MEIVYHHLLIPPKVKGENSGNKEFSFRQERDPITWGAVVAANGILQGRELTDSYIKKILPDADANQRLLAYNKAREIVDRVRSQKIDFKNDLKKQAKAVLDAETDMYYDNRINDFYKSAREGGAEWEYARNQIKEANRRAREERSIFAKSQKPRGI